ncbi:hypothetical protein P692DRAFT_20889556 [Suillus brevipes Sb2]|nr:hypothetical protein P692DRAFT_20889556 [Suillus brevipes Sb2]
MHSFHAEGIYICKAAPTIVALTFKISPFFKLFATKPQLLGNPSLILASVSEIAR